MPVRNLRQAVDLIRSFEGIEDGDRSTVNLNPYLCPAGYWTIGWGHVVLNSEGRAVRGRANRHLAYAMYPDGINMTEAEVLLNNDIRRFSEAIDNLISVPISDTRFCALVSFSFNVGVAAFRDSTLLRLLNQGEYHRVPEQLMRWVRANGQVLEGLRRRREAEGRLWSSVNQ